MMRWMVFAWAGLLVACSAPGPLPDDKFFDLPAPAEQTTTRRLDAPLVVAVPRAAGVRGEQSILYRTPDGELLKYHYLRWSDLPTHLIRRQLVLSLRHTGIAPAIIERTPAGQPHYQLDAKITGMERLLAADGTVSSRVEIDFRLTSRNRSEPVRQIVHAEAIVPAMDDEMNATMIAFGAALDDVISQLLQSES